MIILTILWIIYTVLDAITQAYYYDSNPNTHNIHWLFVAQRGIVLGALSLHLPTDYSLIEVGIFSVGLALIYSFFHNGTYYLTRHKLNNAIYPKGFWSDSTSSTAIMEFNIKWRTAMAVVGFIFIYGLTL